MSAKQQDITRFFSPKAKENQPSNKIDIKATGESKIEKVEPLEDVDGGVEPKKRKIEDKTEQSSSPLSPDQKARMSMNKVLAEIKIASKALPKSLNSNIGPSWFSALKTEFDKPYFKRLDNFLQKERSNKTKIFPPEDQVHIFLKITACN